LSKDHKTKRLFSDEQSDHFEKSYEEELQEEKGGSVECLGVTFQNNEERREYFILKLAEKLKDPEFRKIEGFPIGEDKDILALSDPPYYTACPNPFIEGFIKHNSSHFNLEKNDFHRLPFAADVSEGKNDPIYNAHSYHTKVPHKAIMRYILHYTEPGDVVYDSFCGTGMTGVAAQMCGNRAEVESLGYQVKPDGAILKQETDEKGKSTWIVFSKLGPRHAVLNDLSPAATFIAYNYNTPVDAVNLEQESMCILKEIEEEYSWMYETLHTDGKTKGKINFTVWSDVFVCPDCAEEVIFWDAAIDKKMEKVNDQFPCPHCSVHLSKKNLERSWTSRFDSLLNATIRIAKQKPVLINYMIPKLSGRFEKLPDAADVALIEKIENKKYNNIFPTIEIPVADKTGEPLRIGITHTHLFYTSRNMRVIQHVIAKNNKILNWKAHATALINSKMNRWPRQRGPLSLTLFVGSVVYENNVFKTIRNRKFPNTRIVSPNLISTQSATDISSIENCVDYIFIDPPFGSNIYYSDLNLIWESWLKIITNNKTEAIESRSQMKDANAYRTLMKSAFVIAYRMLKPGRWMTVEFSNTKASVWNSIQTAIAEAGFIVANVSALNKKQGSFNAVTNTTSVKQDLIISAYKPNGGFEERFRKESTTEEGVWDFIRTHLKYLPVIKKHGSILVPVPERDPRILFDQMVAYYVRKGYPIPMSSQEFQMGLAQRFPERDGMYFRADQAAEYDKKRMAAKEFLQLQLFVSDEASAIQWLKQQLTKKPQTYQDIHPKFLKEISGWQKHEKALELSELLEQNFLCYDGRGDVHSQIHTYLSSNFKELRHLTKDSHVLMAKGKDRWYVPDSNKVGDLEKLRDRALLREFGEYCKSKQKRLKIFRLEAVRAGFKKAWQERDYTTIISIADKIPESILQEDPKLLMWYDQALTRSSKV